MIGLFDSGIGGLSIMRALEALLPNEHFYYFADTVHMPYGSKSAVDVERYSSQICAFLLSKGVKLLIVACHTASATALSSLQAHFPIPIIGMIEPTLQMLAKCHPFKKVALLGTPATIRSNIYQREIEKRFENVEVIALSCPELEEKIERGDKDIQTLIKHYVAPLLGQKVDVLILGCTHYSHIQREIEEELDQETRVLNPCMAVAEEACRLYEKPDMPSNGHTFFVSGDMEPIRRFIETYLLHEQNTWIKNPF